MVEKIFQSPQVKRNVITSSKLVYMTCLKNDFRLRILGDQEISEKSQNSIELLPSAQLPSQNGAPPAPYPPVI